MYEAQIAGQPDDSGTGDGVIRWVQRRSTDELRERRGGLGGLGGGGDRHADELDAEGFERLLKALFVDEAVDLGRGEERADAAGVGQNLADEGRHAFERRTRGDAGDVGQMVCLRFSGPGLDAERCVVWLQEKQ